VLLVGEGADLLEGGPPLLEDGTLLNGKGPRTTSSEIKSISTIICIENTIFLVK
jgi:hypothetical protein